MPAALPVELGLIEGFYGRPWPWSARADAIEILAPNGYGFFLYAPKADAYLRRRWREPHPEAERGELARLSTACRALGVRFGVGLSPYELYRDFDGPARAALSEKLTQLDQLGLDDLAILFDDMRGDLPRLAERQAEIVAFVAERTRATRLMVCPTYYTLDPVLDRVFGARPPEYLADLGRMLDPAVQVFWTGDEVCSREITPGGLGAVAEQLRRPPLLWDNYPVNDGPRMSQHLHLRAFTGRSARLAEHVAGHGINLACQPVLSLIPALTLARAYAEGEAYAYGPAFRAAAQAVLGPALADQVEGDLYALEDAGLGGMGDERKARLRARYAATDHPGAREIVAWLDGDHAIAGEVVETQ